MCQISLILSQSCFSLNDLNDFKQKMRRNWINLQFQSWILVFLQMKNQLKKTFILFKMKMLSLWKSNKISILSENYRSQCRFEKKKINWKYETQMKSSCKLTLRNELLITTLKSAYEKLIILSNFLNLHIKMESFMMKN